VPYSKTDCPTECSDMLLLSYLSWSEFQKAEGKIRLFELNNSKFSAMCSSPNLNINIFLIIVTSCKMKFSEIIHCT
jgi:hypothetical protein